MRNVIYPAVLAVTVEEFCKKIELASTFAEGVQIDVMDGAFVPAVTFQDVDRIASCKPGALFFELHLMTERPENHIERWAKVADSYILHIETVADPRPIIEKIRAMKKEVGLAVSPATPLSSIWQFIPLIDTVLVMTVEPGKSGQRYLNDMGSKIMELRKSFHRLPISVDGGINRDTISHAKHAGANIFVAGSAIYNSPDGKSPREAFLQLQSLVQA